MVISVAIYLTVAVSTALLFQAAKRQSRHRLRSQLTVLLAVLVPTLLSGFRWGIGTDYFSYLSAFSVLESGGAPRFSNDIGFIGLNHVLGRLGFDPQSIMFASAALMMTFVALAIKDERAPASDWGLSALVFMLLFYQSSFNIVRMMIAVAVVLYGYRSLEAHRPMRFLLFVGLATTFHASAIAAIFALPFGLLNSVKHSRTFSVLLYGVSGVLILNAPLLIDSFVSITGLTFYSDYGEASGTAIDLPLWRLLLFMPLMLPGAIWFGQFASHDPRFRVYYPLLVVGILITFVSNVYETYLDRVGLYFLVSAVVVIPVYLRTFARRNRAIESYLVIVHLFVYWGIYYVVLNSHETFPYQSIFSV